MALNIKNPQVAKLLEEVVQMTGESKTEAVRKALDERSRSLALKFVRSHGERRLVAFLEDEIWPLSPPELLGTRCLRSRGREHPRLRRHRRMILDSSAVVAIFFQEPGYESLVEKLATANGVGIGAPTLVECGIVLSARLNQDTCGLLARFLEEGNIVIVPFTDAHYGAAVGAWRKYGKGRHPAALNMGDCMSMPSQNWLGCPFSVRATIFPEQI